MSLAENFDSQLVREGDCLLWTRAKKKGYGVLRVNGRMKGAHVFAWEREHGPLSDGDIVCHTCDRPACCNVDHLFVSDNFGNMRDMAAKGRTGGCARTGERNYNAKLCSEDAPRIRDIWRIGGHPQTAIAAHFGVSQMIVSLVVRGKLWKGDSHGA